MGREGARRLKRGMKAVRWVVAKLQGDKLLFLKDNERLRTYKVTNQYPSLP